MTQTQEEWVTLDEFPNYCVSRAGHVLHKQSGRLLRVRFNQFGVPYVGLMRDWEPRANTDPIPRQYVRSLPLLVAEAFVPRTNEVFDTPLQKDGDRNNCAADNLVWRPRWYAVQYNRQFSGEPYESPIRQPVYAINENETFPDSLSAACHYGILEREVVLAVTNKGYAWPTYQLFELA